jgi:glycosyltransferase involved in cell wall biosynthesis
VSVLRVALCCDFPEEQWPSMDRVASELVAAVDAQAWRSGASVDLVAVCPPFTRRASRLSCSRTAFSMDRALNRWRDYPRHIESIVPRFDLFHVIDHSYAHLVHRLPADRTVVTCHDLDTFRSVLQPREEPRSAAFRLATRRILSGLQKAARITCDTAAIRDELLSFGLVPPDRVTVVPVGVGDRFSPEADREADCDAARLVASRPGAIEILHVGSTIARKRIDTLLRTCAAVAARVPQLHLVRVGGKFTGEQLRLIEELGLGERISAVGFVNERTLAAIYRRAAVVLQPSSREGFGLPLLEAMACGTPVVASDLPALREVGGAAAEYCAVGDVAAWTEALTALFDERQRDEARWRARQAAGRSRARGFTWPRFAERVTGIYESVFAAHRSPVRSRPEPVSVLSPEP